MMKLGQKIKEARTAKSFTQEDLAEATQLNLRTIQRIEKGKNTPTSKTLHLISEALELDINEISEVNASIDSPKILNIKLLFPYNWGHFRNVGIYGNDGKLLTKIKHSENVLIRIDTVLKTVIIKLDLFRSVIEIPKNETDLHLIIFMNFRDYFPFIYIDTLKRKCLTGKFVSANEFEKFNLNFYQNSQNWILVSKINRPNLRLGLLLSSSLLIVSIIEQQNEYQDLLFFIGIASFISLLMIFNEKEKLQFFDYKSRMIASGLTLILASFFLNSPFYVPLTFSVFSTVFLLKSFIESKIE